jgi:hypothetical protein
MARGPEARVVARGAEGELVKVRLADQDGAGLAQPGRHDGVRTRHMSFADP